MPQPQQHQIWAASATYTTAHGKARSLTHWARPGIEPASSWILVGFITTEPWWELLSGVSFVRALSSSMRALFSWPNQLPKAASPNVITLGVGWDFNIQIFNPLKVGTIPPLSSKKPTPSGLAQALWILMNAEKVRGGRETTAIGVNVLNQSCL